MRNQESDTIKKSTNVRIKVAQLKSALPRGYTKIVEDKLKVSRKTVSQVINDFDTSHPVMDELISLAEKEAERRKDLERKLETLISQ
jgi:nitrate/TMAO reductase-like tetraheme cytochrome c subunit